jgi:adenylate cyclase
VLLLGIEHIILASVLAAVAAGLIIAVEFLVPRSTGLQPAWVQSTGFVVTAISSVVMVVVTLWFALRDTARAEAVMESEYQRSEALLANMLPGSIAERLKSAERNVIADKYDEASVLFADIVGFTERASSTAPADLVQFLDRLYGAFDELVDKHGLEKIKVSGDSYMVVSGVPRARPDHAYALANFALDMANVAAALNDPHGQAPASWVHDGSSTTCGATPSTSRRGWSPPIRWGESRCPRRCTNASNTTSFCRSGAASKSRARALCARGI